MNFRDMNAKTDSKKCLYRAGMSLRDMNFRAVPEIQEEQEPEQTAPPQPDIPVKRYQSMPVQSVPLQSIPVQSMPLPTTRTRPPQSVYIPPKPESQFLYYTQNTPAKPPVSAPPVQAVPPRPPESEKPDPSKFIEERTPTPPPKMVRVAVPVRKKIDNTNNDFGAFGTTFDGDPEQSTMITEIPVMNNIDDFKI